MVVSKILNDVLKKITNTRVIISLASTTVIILSASGVKIEDDTIMTVVEGVCALGVLLGVFNDKGMETTHWDDRE